MSEGYVTDEDEATDAEQLKKAGKRVSAVHVNVFICLWMHLCLFIRHKYCSYSAPHI